MEPQSYLLLVSGWVLGFLTYWGWRRARFGKSADKMSVANSKPVASGESGGAAGMKQMQKKLDEIEKLVKALPSKPSASALLSADNFHSTIDSLKRYVDKSVEMGMNDLYQRLQAGGQQAWLQQTTKEAGPERGPSEPPRPVHVERRAATAEPPASRGSGRSDSNSISAAPTPFRDPQTIIVDNFDRIDKECDRNIDKMRSEFQTLLGGTVCKIEKAEDAVMFYTGGDIAIVQPLKNVQLHQRWVSHFEVRGPFNDPVVRVIKPATVKMMDQGVDELVAKGEIENGH